MCKIDASGQFADFEHLHAHLHPGRGLYPNSGFHPDWQWSYLNSIGDSGLHHDSATSSVVFVCGRTSTISYNNYVRQGYSDILVFCCCFFLKSILKY